MDAAAEGGEEVEGSYDMFMPDKEQPSLVAYIIRQPLLVGASPQHLWVRTALAPSPIRRPGYLLRIWEERSVLPPYHFCRIMHECAGTGERRGFSSFEGLVPHLQSRFDAQHGEHDDTGAPLGQ
jgi:hypothetical protein